MSSDNKLIIEKLFIVSFITKVTSLTCVINDVKKSPVSSLNITLTKHTQKKIVKKTQTIIEYLLSFDMTKHHNLFKRECCKLLKNKIINIELQSNKKPPF